jgi:hypothetical protein
MTNRAARRTPPFRLARAVLAVLAVLAGAAGAARADAPASADTSLGGYLRVLSDSTDRYFGRSAVPTDTAGLDTLHGTVMIGTARRRLGISALPSLGFSRVDGTRVGGSLGLDLPGVLGRLRGSLIWAMGPDRWLGGGGYENRFRWRGQRGWRIHAWGGRETEGMNREGESRWLSPLRALVSGSDYSHYLRADGWEAGIERETAAWRAALGWRDELESPLATTATWNFAHRTPVVPGNLPAAFGRVRELAVAGGIRTPLLPLRIEAAGAFAGGWSGSDLSYRRLRIAAGGEFPIAHAASLVPQALWGGVDGDRVPQAAFYAGGTPTLRSVHTDVLGGTRLAAAKLDLVAAGDLFTALHLPHSPALFVQPGAFAATAAVSGPDPYGGPVRPGGGWPDARNWRSEAGLALHYNLGIIGARVVASVAWPLGPTDGRGTGYDVSITRLLDFLRRPYEE